MPLLIITGAPASGKSTIAERIAEHLRSTGKSVEIVADQLNGQYSPTCFNDSLLEREQRNFLRSEVQKRTTKDVAVICDSLNYIKGFRYELFCIAKLIKTTFCVLECSADVDTSRWLNEQKMEEKNRYADRVLEDLAQRYEPPDAKNRWDSPLFRLDISQTNAPRDIPLPLEDIYGCLFEAKALAPNLSTQSAPLAATNFLHELDRTTQEVVQSILEQQKTALPGDSLILPGCSDRLQLRRVRTLAELSRLRRQFIIYTKAHHVHDVDRIASLFVNFLSNDT